MRVFLQSLVWAAFVAALGCDSVPAKTELSPAVGRPDGVTQGPRVAVVVAVRGDVTITPASGEMFVATAEQQLLRDDRVRTAPGSFVVLELHNGHIVRLNQGSDLRVDALAVFDDPPAGDDRDQRFAALLAPDEAKDLELRGAITRVAGWNTRMSAGHTIAPLAADARSANDLSQADEDAAIGGRDRHRIPANELPAPEQAKEENDAPPAVASGQPKQDETPDRTGNTVPPSPSPDKKKTSSTPAESKPKPPPPRKPTDSSASGPSSGSPGGPSRAEDDADSEGRRDQDAVAKLPDRVRFTPNVGTAQDVALPPQFGPHRATLAKCAGIGAEVRLRIQSGKVTEIQVNKQTSACAPALKQVALNLADGWISLRVIP